MALLVVSGLFTTNNFVKLSNNQENVKQTNFETKKWIDLLALLKQANMF